MLQKLYLIGVITWLFSLSSFAEDTAKLLFDQSSPLVFQVKVIDKASGNKSTIGSGFLVSSDGAIATNYHVISNYVLENEKYSIEVLDHDNKTFDATLVNFDVIHDLALLHIKLPKIQPLRLSFEQLHNGNRIYSMGNPHDLGMTIIEGNYNGLVEGSRYKKYLFSGSLNGGMSGGPVLNHLGEVVGINVSKGGEQLSFLVPVSHLVDLLNQGSQALNVDKYQPHIIEHLMKDQNDYYALLLEIDWLNKEFQQFVLPDKIHDSLKCWGHTLDKKDKRFDEFHRHCRTEDSIYLNEEFYTGAFSFSYENLSSDELNVFQFYSLLEENYAMRAFSNSNDKNDTTNFACNTSFLNLGGSEDRKSSWKVTSCIREYKEYRGLYDAGLIAVHAYPKDDYHSALVVSLTTTGIDKNNILEIHRKFLDSITWKE